MRQNEIIKNIPDVPTDRLVYMYVIYTWWLQVVDRALNILPTSRSPRGGVANSLGSNCIAFSEDCFTAESSMQQCRSPQNPIKTIARLDGFLSPENLILVTGVGLPLLSPSLCAASIGALCKDPYERCNPLSSAGQCRCSHCSAASSATAVAEAGWTTRWWWLLSNHSLNALLPAHVTSSCKFNHFCCRCERLTVKQWSILSLLNC